MPLRLRPHPDALVGAIEALGEILREAVAAIAELAAAAVHFVWVAAGRAIAGVVLEGRHARQLSVDWAADG